MKRIHELNGRLLSVSELAKIAGLGSEQIRLRLKRGWSPEQAVQPMLSPHDAARRAVAARTEAREPRPVQPCEPIRIDMEIRAVCCGPKVHGWPSMPQFGVCPLCKSTVRLLARPVDREAFVDMPVSQRVELKFAAVRRAS